MRTVIGKNRIQVEEVMTWPGIRGFFEARKLPKGKKPLLQKRAIRKKRRKQWQSKWSEIWLSTLRIDSSQANALEAKRAEQIKPCHKISGHGGSNSLVKKQAGKNRKDAILQCPVHLRGTGEKRQHD